MSTAESSETVAGGVGFDAALRGAPTRMLCSDGAEITLAVGRWHLPADAEDDWMLDRCTGPVLDLGCGPGRLVAALKARGIPALGVDESVAAATHCPTAVLRCDLFGPLPGEGGWAHVLLADGNIGIGGDPARLLARVRSLLGPEGTALVEADPAPDTHWTGTARLHTEHGMSTDIPWAVVGRRALVEQAALVGLSQRAQHCGQRTFVELARC